MSTERPMNYCLKSADCTLSGHHDGPCNRGARVPMFAQERIDALETQIVMLNAERVQQAHELDRLRVLERLVYGGTCPDCHGAGELTADAYEAPATAPCRSCVSGRTPGAVDELDRIVTALVLRGGTLTDEQTITIASTDLTALASRLRRAGGTDA